MSGVNLVILIGALGRDPELKYGANGSAVANLSIATSKQWKDKNTGQKQEKTEWHRVVVFGKLAEIAGQYLAKGSQVYLQGELQTRKWQDPNTGQDRYITEVVLNDFSHKMQMLGGPSYNGEGQSEGGAGQTNQGMQNQANFTAQAPAQNPNVNQPAPSMNPSEHHGGAANGTDGDVPF